MRRTTADIPNYPNILFVYQGTAEDGEWFFGKLWPEARAVSDEKREFYTGFGIKRASTMELLGPSVVACGVRAAAKGHIVGVPKGDTTLMPGLFLVQGEQIVWQHSFSHIADHPDWKKVMKKMPASKPTATQTTVL